MWGLVDSLICRCDNGCKGKGQAAYVCVWPGFCTSPAQKKSGMHGEVVKNESVYWTNTGAKFEGF